MQQKIAVTTSNAMVMEKHLKDHVLMEQFGIKTSAHVYTKAIMIAVTTEKEAIVWHTKEAVRKWLLFFGYAR